MSDLQKIRESVLAKAHHEGQALFQTAQLSQQQAYDQAFQSAMRDKQAHRKHVLDREISQLSRLEQQIANQTRQANLKSRQALVDDLFEGAVEKMQAWSAEETLSFIQNVLKAFDGQTLKLVLHKDMQDRLGQKGLDQLLSQYPQLSLDFDRQLNKPGFILSQGAVDYNYTFDQLVKSQRENLSTQLSQQVFQEH